MDKAKEKNNLIFTPSVLYKALDSSNLALNFGNLHLEDDTFSSLLYDRRFQSSYDSLKENIL